MLYMNDLRKYIALHLLEFLRHSIGLGIFERIGSQWNRTPDLQSCFMSIMQPISSIPDFTSASVMSLFWWMLRKMSENGDILSTHLANRPNEV